MHNSYHFLKRWVEEFQSDIEGAVLVDCFAQTSEELVLQIEGDHTLFLKTYISNDERVITRKKNK